MTDLLRHAFRNADNSRKTIKDIAKHSVLITYILRILTLLKEDIDVAQTIEAFPTSVEPVEEHSVTEPIVSLVGEHSVTEPIVNIEETDGNSTHFASLLGFRVPTSDEVGSVKQIEEDRKGATTDDKVILEKFKHTEEDRNNNFVIPLVVDELENSVADDVQKSRASPLFSGNWLPSDNSDYIQVASSVKRSYESELEQSGKGKQGLLAEIGFEEQRGRELSKINNELSPTKNINSSPAKESNSLPKPPEPPDLDQHVMVLPPPKPSKPPEPSNLKNTLSPQQEPLNDKVETYIVEANIQDIEVETPNNEVTMSLTENIESYVVLTKDGVQDVITGSYIFVCAHGSRDMRCGVYGHVLIDKFNEEIQLRGLKDQISVMACSHIGGHLDVLTRDRSSYFVWMRQYPRRCRTGQKHYDKNPLYEERNILDFNVPRDEAFAETKQTQLNTYVVSLGVTTIIQSLDAIVTYYRVSAVISNSPYILVLDCDMFCSEPASARQALCFHLDPKKLAFVQFPQKFHNISKNDIYDNQHRSAYTVIWQGIDAVKKSIPPKDNT